jgi:hypothetical protein
MIMLPDGGISISLPRTAVTAGVNVSDQTIRNRLHSRKLGPRRPVVRIPLTLHHRRLGLDWCRRHLPWTARWVRLLNVIPTHTITDPHQNDHAP